MRNWNGIFQYQYGSGQNTYAVYYNIQLCIKVDMFPIGTKFVGCYIHQKSNGESVIAFFDSETETAEYIFKLNFSVGEKIN